jgi:hypothetical protein
MKQRLGVAAVTGGFVIVVAAFSTAIILGWRPGPWVVVGIVAAILALLLVVLVVLWCRARRAARVALEETCDDERRHTPSGGGLRD